MSCLEGIIEAEPHYAKMPVRIWVDSQLIIRHLLGIYKKPSKVRVY